MKRLLLPFALVFASQSLLASPVTTDRYLVGTRRAARLTPARILEAVGIDEPRAVTAFMKVDGFAAELTQAEAALLTLSPEVRFVEHDPERHMFSERGHKSASARIEALQTRDRKAQTTPYGIEMVGAPSLWRFATGSRIKVGVIDTGIDKFHADLRDRYKGGRNFVAGTNDPQDDNGHGTHVAGTIAASDDGLGVVGVAPTVEIYALKALNGNGSGTSAKIIEAVDWAIANDLDILSLSLGSYESSLLEEEAFKRAEDAGILTIAASGNDGEENKVSFPAAYSSVIAVGAIDAAFKVASFSNGGGQLRLVGPGVRVLSSVLRGTAEVAEVTSPTRTISAGNMIGSPAEAEVGGEFVYCGYGNTGDFPSSVRGRIALIKRGGVPTRLTFNAKAKNAKAAGAIAVIVFDDKPPGPFVTPTLIGTISSPAGCTTLCTVKNDPADLAFEWPLSLFVSKSEGEALLTEQFSPITASSRRDDYDELSGTSMSAPHVSGVAALIWSLVPDASAAAVRIALIRSARDLGAEGLDTTFGYGLVDAHAAALVLAPEKIGAGATPLPPPPPVYGRRRATRP